MNRLAWIGVGLGAVFLATFAVGVALGWLGEEPTVAWLGAMIDRPGGRMLIAALVFALLAGDIVLGVPATPLMVAAGHLLGPWLGGLVASAGALAAVTIGYGLCRLLGEPFARRRLGEHELARGRRWFDDYGIATIVLTRPLPIVPEVLACMAGLSKMHAGRFFAAFAAVTVPWAFSHAIAGAWSNVENPWPAIWLLIGLPAVAWVFWRRTRRKRRAMRDAR